MLRALPLFALTLFFACSGGEPGPGAGGDPLRTEAGFCEEWAKLACNELVVERCNGSTEDCRESQEAACDDLVPFGYDMKYARDCLNAVRDAYEDAELDSEELRTVLLLEGECSRLVTGSRDEAESCSVHTDCDTVDGYTCIVRPGAAEGECHKPQVVAGGDPCSEPQVVCPDTNYCNASNDCVRRKADGVACVSDAECNATLRCVIAEGETGGACTPRIASGSSDTCIDGAECMSGICIGATSKRCYDSVLLTVESQLCEGLR